MEEIENQEKLWDRIAPEWNEYKQIPSVGSSEFVKNVKGNLLDLGSGSGRHLQKINGSYYLQDISSEMLKLASKKATELGIKHETIHSSMNTIPKEDDFFDAAICISALHSVEGKENRLRAISELYRVLKIGGKAFIGVWNKESKRFKRQTKRGETEKLVGWQDKGKRYYYLHGEEEIHNQFKEVGFKIISTHNSEQMINFIVEK
ncbi:class I SAM-dependent methyltransferase [archaeon]|nr:class I SAM-dependent methyltransferase [archaeon]